MDAKLNKLKSRFNLSRQSKETIKEIALFVLGFALMPVRFFFGTYPFALALGGACKRSSPFVFAGALLSSALLM